MKSDFVKLHNRPSGIGKFHDFDECVENLHNCDADATCNNTIGSWTCTCKQGFNGTGLVCMDVDDCQLGTTILSTREKSFLGLDNCHADSDCINTEGSFDCECRAGYDGNGIVCSDIDECEFSNDCHFGAQCKNLPSNYKCSCKKG